jgi:hypothetical protein
MGSLNGGHWSLDLRPWLHGVKGYARFNHGRWSTKGWLTVTHRPMAAVRHSRRRRPRSSSEATGLADPELRFQHGTAQNEDGATGVLTLGLLWHGTMARRCAAGHLSSQAQASATGNSEVSPTRTRDVDALGNPDGPSRLVGGARWLYFGSAMAVDRRQACDGFQCSKQVIGVGLL